MKSIKSILLFLLVGFLSVAIVAGNAPSVVAQKSGLFCTIDDPNDTSLNVRDFPSTINHSLYEEISTVKFQFPNGTRVKAIAETDDGRWFFVYTNGKWGWVFSDYLDCS
mgnify:CR=1 FL=1